MSTLTNLSGIVILFCVFISFESTASPVFQQDQSEKDSLQFEHFIAKANRNLDSATFYFDQAEKFTTTPSLKIRLARMKGWYLFDLKKYDSAVAFVTNVLEETDTEQTNATILEAAGIYNALRNFNIARNDYYAAIEAGHKFLEYSDKGGGVNNEIYGSGLVNLAIDYWRIKKYHQALAILRDAEAFIKEQPTDEMEITTYMMFGLVYEDLNDLPLAAQCYKYVFEVIGDDYKKWLRMYMANCNNLGIVYNQSEQYDSALSYYNKALYILENEELDKAHQYLLLKYKCDVLRNIGNTYYYKEDYAKAITFLIRASEKLKEMQEDHPYLPSVLGALSKAYMRIGDFDNSHKALEESYKVTLLHGIDRALILNYYADLYKEEGKYDLAIQYYDSAIYLNDLVEFDAGKFYAFPDLVIESFKGKSQAVVKSSKNGAEIEALYDETIDLIKHLYAKTNSIYVFTGIDETLDVYYNFFNDQYNESKDFKWVNYLWEISELSKAATLKKQLRDNYSLTYSIPEDIHNNLQNLKDSINLMIGKLKPGETDSALFSLNRRLKALNSTLEKDYPNYHALKNLVKVTPLTEELEKVSDNSVSFSFYEGEDETQVILMKKESVEAWGIDKEEFHKLINDFNESLLTNSEESIKELSSELRNKLKIDKLFNDGIKQFVIYPDGMIWGLNFAAIETPKGYLGNAVSLNYKHFSDIEVQSIEHGNNVLAFSYNDEDDIATNSYFTFRDLDESIPGTSREVYSISKLWDGDYYFAKEANETNFKQLSNQYSIIHLAVHGVQDENHPENSFLQFAAKDSLNDGKLYAYELYNLNVNAQLAVLSACHSGKGKIVKGEGMKSIAQAFSYAGVRSVLGSRWLVPDVSAPPIMQYFYQGLSQGMKKSEALKFAQNQYLQNDADQITSAPFYWAGFYIIGDDDPIERSSGTGIWLMLLLSVLVAAYIGYKRFK